MRKLRRLASLALFACETQVEINSGGHPRGEKHRKEIELRILSVVFVNVQGLQDVRRTTADPVVQNITTQ